MLCLVRVFGCLVIQLGLQGNRHMVYGMEWIGTVIFLFGITEGFLCRLICIWSYFVLRQRMDSRNMKRHSTCS